MTILQQHIALLTYNYPPETGGVQAYLFELVLGLTKRGVQVSVISPLPAADASADGATHITTRGYRAFDFIRALAGVNASTILIGHVHPQLLLASFPFRRKNRICIAYGNDFVATQLHWHKRITNSLLRNVDQVVTIANSNKQRLADLDISNVIIIPPGTDPDFFVPPDPIEKPTLTLLTVGRLVPRKGVDSVLYALAQLTPAFPQLRYHIIGDGPARVELEALATELGLSDLVTFAGRVSSEALLAAYQAADIFIMVSREETQIGSIEGFGIVYLEAAACGLPVIVGDSGGAPDAVLGGISGLLVQPDRIDSITGGIRKLLEDADLRRAMGREGRKWVSSEMRWDAVADRFATILVKDVK